MRDQLFAIERCERTGPGLKAAPAIVELVRRARGKIHAAIFAVEQGREGCALVVLRLRLDGSVGKAGQRLHHQRRAGAGEHSNRSTAV